MGNRSKSSQHRQVAASEAYNDQVFGPHSQPTAEGQNSLEGDLNVLRTLVKNLIDMPNWYDPAAMTISDIAVNINDLNISTGNIATKLFPQPIRNSNFDNFSVNGNSSNSLDSAIKLFSDHNNGLGSPSVSGVVLNSTRGYKIDLRDTLTQNPIDDGNDNEVYARLDFVGGEYILNFFSYINGVETPYTFSSPKNIDATYVIFSREYKDLSWDRFFDFEFHDAIGMEGAQGSQGVVGPQGVEGNPSIVPGPQGNQGSQGLQGFQGVIGSNGATWYAGSGTPGSGIGEDGDFYLNVDTGDIYNKSSGSWSVVGNILGPQGTQGPQGNIGVNGTDGAQGPQGNTGADSTVEGPQGLQGNQGLQGLQGFQGNDGSVWLSDSGVPDNLLGKDGDYYLDTDNGDVYIKDSGTWNLETNITGPQGQQGNQGLRGLQGFQGIVGIDGSQGFQGNIGQDGIQGPQGNIGLNGIDGNQGFQGNVGADSTVEGPQGLQGSQGNQGLIGDVGPQGNIGFQGVQGFQGVDGATWHTGSGIPDSLLGKDGDLYLDTDNGDIYVKDSGTWNLETNIIGPQGQQGNQGEVGNTGSQGVQGWQGDGGPVGPQGPQGLFGPQGFSPQGNQGSQGFQGNQGAQGLQGSQGWQGAQGLVGDQ
jgi:hypothetical protein